MTSIKLITFDIDGTLLTDEMENEGQYVKGIIPTKVLEQLQLKGINVALVSPSPYGPEALKDDQHWFCRNGSNDYRWENIQDAMKAFGVTKDETIYIDDLDSNINQILKWSVQSYTPEAFMFMIDNNSIKI